MPDDKNQPTWTELMEGHFFGRVLLGVSRVFDGPVTWFRESVVVPNRKEYNWYHQQFRRVPTIDECYVDDRVCWYEANEQFKRDRWVDGKIVHILRSRTDHCIREEFPDHENLCLKLKAQYDEAAANWFAKYGDLGPYYSVEKAYMKQKHRLLWERRHGKIGTGMKSKYEIENPESSVE